MRRTFTGFSNNTTYAMIAYKRTEARTRVQMRIRETNVPTGPKGQKRPADAIGCAVHVAKIATGEVEDSELAYPAKSKSGLAGSKARTEKLTAVRRREIARAAAAARWSNADD